MKMGRRKVEGGVGEADQYQYVSQKKEEREITNRGETNALFEEKQCVYKGKRHFFQQIIFK